MWSLSFACLVILLDPVLAASAGRKTVKADISSSNELESVAGPIVKAVVDRLKDANATDTADKKKTIAQMIDAALEQEFPEEKEEAIGKNYNETAKNSDVSCHCRQVPGRVFVCSFAFQLYTWLMTAYHKAHKLSLQATV